MSSTDQPAGGVPCAEATKVISGPSLAGGMLKGERATTFHTVV
jgi:hypothetical protein